MSKEQAHIALSRFGMGAAPGEVAAIAADPGGWLRVQLDRPNHPASLDSLPGGTEMQRRIETARRAKDKENKGELRHAYMAEAAARTRAAAASPTPFVERLVRFWSNHFTVSTSRLAVAPLTGPFEREAIRPHVLGRFHAMLRAVVRHPAMLGYLDNIQSIGPNSEAGRKRAKGLNENLAREVLELHTLGVGGGFGQADVEGLARILTGWTVDRDDFGFRFAPRLHEPGPKTLLGKTFDGGEDEGEAALLMLSRHPATARFVAVKLARHFVADDPPATMVDALARAFIETDGDLGVLSRLLVTRAEAWTRPLTKVRSPDDLVIATMKALGEDPGNADGSERRILQSLTVMGQAPWSAPSPAGWPDRGEAWLGPEALMRRLEWAKALAGRIGRRADAGLAEQVIMAGAATRQTLAGTRGADALFLLLASREFQRR